MKVLGDTCYFIDVERHAPGIERATREGEWTFVILCEIVRAELLSGDRPPRNLPSDSSVLTVDSAVAERWAKEARDLRRRGQTVGANDLWIAAIALVHGLPVLTRDASFERIPGLSVIDYSASVA